MKHLRTTATQVKKLKQAARRRRDQTGEPLMSAQDAVAREAGYLDFHHVNECLKRSGLAPTASVLDAVARFAADGEKASFQAMHEALRRVFLAGDGAHVDDEPLAREAETLAALACREDLVPVFARWADVILGFSVESGRGFGVGMVLEPLPRKAYPVGLRIENVEDLEKRISTAIGARMTLGLTAMLAIGEDPCLQQIMQTPRLEFEYCRRRALSGGAPPPFREPNPPILALEGERYYVFGWVDVPPGQSDMAVRLRVENAAVRGMPAILQGGGHRLATSIQLASVGAAVLMCWYSDAVKRFVGMVSEIQGATHVPAAEMTAGLVVSGCRSRAPKVRLQVLAGKGLYEMPLPKASPLLLYLALRATSARIVKQFEYMVES